MNNKSISVLLGILQIGLISSHGILRVPPARSTAWRERPDLFPANYNDYEMNCGGKSTQWDKNNGNCGICGEDFAKPKRYEKGGDLYRGHIVRTYNNKDKIDITIHFAPDHMGWYEFRLCNVDNIPNGEATHECLNQNLLADENGQTRFRTSGDVAGHEMSDVTVKRSLVIPSNFKCNHCVLQWKWHVGNSWGADFVTGQWCNKCGPQEQFYGCSDIKITDGQVIEQQENVTTKPTNLVSLWGQCGGIGYTGPTNCGSNAICNIQNEYYSQCIPVY